MVKAAAAAAEEKKRFSPRYHDVREKTSGKSFGRRSLRSGFHLVVCDDESTVIHFHDEHERLTWMIDSVFYFFFLF